MYSCFLNTSFSLVLNLTSNNQMIAAKHFKHLFNLAK